MCKLARALANCSRLMNIATFLAWNLQEKGRKSYVASYWANEELVILQIFSRKLRQ